MKKYKLGEICTIVPGYAFKATDFGKGLNYVIKIKDIMPPYIDILHSEKVETVIDKKYEIKYGDFVMAMTGATIGKIGKLQIDSESKIYINQRVCKFIPEAFCDKEYLYYKLNTQEFQRFIYNNVDNKLAQPNIGHPTIYKYELELPLLSEQRRIGQFLKAIDDKIALNRSINHNLETMAKQLYDYWFVQFDFPDENGKPYKSSGGKMVWNEKLKREIPEGWHCFRLNEIEPNIVTGKTPSTTDETNFGGAIPFITIDDIRKSRFVFQTTRTLSEKGAYSQLRKYIPIGSLCCSCIGTVGILGFVGKRGQTNQQINTIVFENEYNKEYVFFSLGVYFSYANAKVGNILPNMSKEDFCQIPLLYPTKTLVLEYHKKVEHLFSQIECLIANIEDLTTLRDLLLPLLMNGQVSLNYDLSSCILSIFSYNRIEQSRTHLMNKKMIDKIVAAMSEVLEVAQQMRLRVVLQESFAQVVMSPAESEKRQRQQANEELLQAFIAAKKIEGCSEKTLHYYTSTIEALLNMVQKRIDEYDTNDIRTYLSHYQEERGSSRVTIDNIRRIFSSFFAWLEDEDYIAKSPVRRIHKVRTESLVKEVLSDEHMEVLRDSCTELRDLAMIDLLASTGVRVGELVQMNCADIDFHERQCVVLWKGNKEREVYFNARTKIHLQRYLESRRDQNPALFVALSSPHNRLTIGGIESRLRQLGKRVGLNKVHPHKFRRTLATMAIDKGMPIEQVQRLLGHVKIDTTLHYAMVNQTNVKMAHRKYIS